MRIVPASIEDIAVISQINKVLHEELYTNPAYIKSILRDDEVYLAQTPKNVAAMHISYIPGALRIMTIAVNPDMQKKGIGTALVNFAIHLAQQQEIHTLSCGTTNTYNSNAFIEKNGFTLVQQNRNSYEYLLKL